jgi:CheY-like chemotaxis protein
MGCRVVEAEDGAQALDLARAEPPDLIVMDVMMPVMSGLEALQILRADSRFAATPVVMLTAKADAATVSRAVEHHASDYLLKDSPPLEIKRRLQKYLPS